MASPNISDLYLILTKVAAGADFRGYLHGVKSKQEKNTVTYGELSRIYKELTSQQVDPQFGWARPLADLDKVLLLAGRPALSAVVVCGEAVGEEKAFLPGDGWWANAPADPEARKEYWRKKLEGVRAAQWPTFSELAKNPKVLAHFLKGKK